MSKTLIFMKTHLINNAVLNEYKKLSNSLNENEDCILFLDNESQILCEKPGELPINGIKYEQFGDLTIPIFLFNSAKYRYLNLPFYEHKKVNAEYQKAMWYNSDYSLYAMRRFFPDYDYYWQIEYDVYCNGSSYHPFFDKYRNSSADLIVSDIRQHKDNDENWGWVFYTDWAYKGVQKWGCFFPVIRLSAKAADVLYAKRLEQAEYFKSLPNTLENRWIFTEVFVPTECACNGLSMEEIDEPMRYEPVYNLNIDRIWENPDFKLYHPVK